MRLHVIIITTYKLNGSAVVEVRIIVRRFTDDVITKPGHFKLISSRFVPKKKWQLDIVAIVSHL